LDNDLDRRYHVATILSKNEFAKTGLVNLSLWLGWLRSAENFHLEWRDVTFIEPEKTPSIDFPRGCRVVQFYMQPETKSNRSQTADIVIASKTLSGYRIGRWLHRVRSTSGFGPDWSEDATFVFAHPDGSAWTSEYFRFRYPCTLPWKLNTRPTLSFVPSMALPEIIFARNYGCYTAITEGPGHMYPEPARNSLAIVERLKPKSTSTDVGVASNPARRSMRCIANG
jgi:hypothetical protein